MIKRQLYYDNEYNTCVCINPRDHRRVPAEKPFEGRTKIKKKKDDKHHVKRIHHRREENYDCQPVPYCTYKYVPYNEERESYKPKLILSFDHVDNVKQISSETTEEQSCCRQRTVNGQYPCVYVQPEYFQPCECGCRYKKCADPKCSYPRRAWNAVKSKTKEFFASKPKRCNEPPIFNEYFQGCGNPYLYPVPISCSHYHTRHVPKKKHYKQLHTKNHAVGTRKNFNGQSINSSISEEIYSTKETISEDPKICPKRLKEECHKESMISPTQGAAYPEPVPRNECCCVCDVDWCDCRCCCTGQCADDYNVDIHRNTQTSMQNIKERFTQTDFPKRCCRCCKCCNRKSKCYTSPLSSMPTNRRPLSGKCGGCDNCLYKKGPCLPNPHFECSQNRKNDNILNEGETEKANLDGVHFKTQMVKTNSVQCIPIVENKATSYDDPNLSMKMTDLMKDLWDGKYDLNYDEKCKKSMGDIPVYKTDIDWTTNFLQSITSRNQKKSKNFFLDDGLFSSPLSGKQYDLSNPEVNVSPRIIKKNLPKPLELNDILKCCVSKKLYHSYGEHNTLISAICDAILKKHDDDMCIGNSQFMCKDDLSSKQNLQDSNEEKTKKIGENEKPKIISKIIPKSILSKAKKSSKQSIFVDNSSNTIRTGLIPVRNNKKTAGKKIIKKKSEKIPNENCNEKKALKKVSNCERFNCNSSESRDFYQNIENKHSSDQKRDNSSIDYDKVKNLDFSSIKFKKTPFDMNASEYFRQKYINQKNFILNNLPAYSSSISNEYQIKSLLSEEKIRDSCELIENTSTPHLQRSPSVSTTTLDPKLNLKININNGNKLIKLKPRERNVDEILAEIEEETQERKYKDFNFFGKKS